METKCLEMHVVLGRSHTWVHGLDSAFFFFPRCYLFVFREKGREGEREREKHQWVVASRAPLTRDLAQNPGMCPDWELNWRPFGSQAGTQSTEPHQPGLDPAF